MLFYLQVQSTSLCLPIPVRLLPVYCTSIGICHYTHDSSDFKVLLPTVLQIWIPKTQPLISIWTSLHSISSSCFLGTASLEIEHDSILIRLWSFATGLRLEKKESGWCCWREREDLQPPPILAAGALFWLRWPNNSPSPLNYLYIHPYSSSFQSFRPSYLIVLKGQRQKREKRRTEESSYTGGPIDSTFLSCQLLIGMVLSYQMLLIWIIRGIHSGAGRSKERGIALSKWVQLGIREWSGQNRGGGRPGRGGENEHASNSANVTSTTRIFWISGVR